MKPIKHRFLFIRVLKRLWRQETCKHTHIFKHAIPDDSWYSRQENGRYKDMGEHGQLQICGCYICGKVWAKDYGA